MKISTIIIGLFFSIYFTGNAYAQVICSEEFKFIKKTKPRPVVVDTSQPLPVKVRGMFSKKLLWDAGSTLIVKFMDGDDFLQEQVKKFAPEWCKYANINFEFKQVDDADIRVTFDSVGEAWSMIGRDAKLLDNKYSTISLGFFKDFQKKNLADSFYKELTLHEFGHVLGLEHEHLSPLRGFQWSNKDSVYAYFIGPPNNWDSANVKYNLFTKMDMSHSNGKYDPYSIMHYTMPEKLLKNNYKIPNNFTLSEGDKTTIASLYPPNNLIRSNTVNSIAKKATCYGIRNPVLSISDNDNLLIYPIFTVSNGKNSYVKIVVFFYDKKGNAIINSNASHLKNNDQVVAGKENVYLFNNVEKINQQEEFTTSLAIPLSDLLVINGEKTILQYKVGIYWKEHLIGMSKLFSVTLN